MRDRPPSARDDINAGFRPGSLWLCDAGAFVALRATPGHAVWRARHFVPEVLDQLDGPRPLAAYGMTRLSAVHAGPCADVVRRDGSAATIGFTPDGAFDRAGLMRFMGDAPARVTCWYDQSGHGLHATSALAHAPTIALGRHHALVFEGGDRLIMPPGVRTRTDACCAFACGRSANSLQASVFLRLGGADASTSIILGGGLAARPAMAAVIGDRPAESGRFPTLSMRVAGITTRRDRAHVVHDEGGFTTLGAIPRIELAGGAIGGAGAVELSSVIVLDAPVFGPGDPNHDAIRACQYLALGIVPRARRIYVADGDSITEGMGATGGESYPRQMEALLAHPTRLYNCGLSGDTLEGRDGAYAQGVAELLDPCAAINVLSIFAGTNDLANGATAGDLAGHISRYCARARASGFRVIVATILPRPDLGPGQEHERRAHNDFLRERWPGLCDGLADMAVDPALATRSTDRAYYIDGLHPTSLGYTHIAQIMADAVNLLLA